MEYNCNCSICKTNKSFEIPEALIKELLAGNVVIFAGAGISTESRNIIPSTFYDTVRHDLKISHYPSFPELMSEYCKQPNGRKILLQKIKDRFDYIQQYYELYIDATEFHRELSHLWMIDTIITTNWDDYFEKECNAIPIVTNQDFAFYNLPQRKILKIHGSIHNYGSIVATLEDYDECLKKLKEGIVGSVLKTILATKTVVFVGYSFGDFNFNQIFEFIHNELGAITPHFYLVTLDDTASNRLQGYNISTLTTNAAYFIHKIRKRLEENFILICDDRFASIKNYEESVRECRSEYLNKYNVVTTPAALYSHFFQDGLLHAFDYIRFRQRTGEIYNPSFVYSKIAAYSKSLKNERKNKNYSNISYIEGFMAGLIFLLAPEEILDHPPFFYLFGVGEICSGEEYEDLLPKAETLHGLSINYAKKKIKKIANNNPEILIHHRPVL